MSKIGQNECPVHVVGEPSNSEITYTQQSTICVIITNSEDQVAVIQRSDDSNYRLPQVEQHDINWKQALQCALAETGCQVKIIKKDPICAIEEYAGETHTITYCFEAHASAIVRPCTDAVVWVDLPQTDRVCYNDESMNINSLDERDRIKLLFFNKDRRRDSGV